jgi:hypothetical protein
MSTQAEALRLADWCEANSSGIYRPAAEAAVTCEKVAHTRDGYLHAEDDDTPYDVDGVSYCGRCHRSLP